MLSKFRRALRAPFPRTLDHVLALRGRCALPALTQLLATLLGQLLKPAEILAGGLLALWRQRPELLPALAQLFAPLLRQLLPLTEALPSLRALVRRHSGPALAAAGQGLLALWCELIPLPGEPRQALLGGLCEKAS